MVVRAYGEFLLKRIFIIRVTNFENCRLPKIHQEWFDRHLKANKKHNLFL